MELCSLLENKEMYHRTCVLCSGTVLELENEDVPDTEHLMKSIPRLLHIEAPSDLVNDLSRTSVCSACSEPIGEGHKMLLQLDQIQKKIDDISILLKVKIMEGIVRQSTATNTQYYPAVLKLTNKVRGNLAGCLNLGSIVNTLAKSSDKNDASEQNSVVLVLDSDPLRTEVDTSYHLSSSNDIEYGDADDAGAFFSPADDESPCNQEGEALTTEIHNSVGHGYATFQQQPLLVRSPITNANERIHVTSSADNLGLNDTNARRKRIRNPNFTPAEVSILVSEYKKHKRRSRNPNHPQKRIEWEKIAKTVRKRSSSQVRRTGEQCERKISDMMRARYGLAHLLKDDNDDILETADDGEGSNSDEDEDVDSHLRGDNEGSRGDISQIKIINISTGNISSGTSRELFKEKDDAVLKNPNESDDDSRDDDWNPRDESCDDVELEHAEEAQNKSRQNAESGGRKRQPNFTRKEVITLATEYKKHQRRRSDPYHPQNRIEWDEIAEIVYKRSSSKVRRTGEQCQQKIRHMKDSRSGFLHLLKSDSILEGTDKAKTDDSNQDDYGELNTSEDDLEEGVSFGFAKRRQPNYFKDEISILVREYQEHLRRCSDSNHPQNSIGWAEIAQAVSAGSSSKFRRTAHMCQRKIIDMKNRGDLAILRGNRQINTNREADGELQMDQDETRIDDVALESAASGVDINVVYSVREHRKRLPYFGTDEIAILVSEYKKHLRRSADTDNPRERIEWDKIAQEVSTRSGSKYQRTAVQCEAKISEMKRKICRGMKELIDDDKILKSPPEQDDDSIPVEDQWRYYIRLDEEYVDSDAIGDDLLVEKSVEPTQKPKRPIFVMSEISILVSEYKKHLRRCADPNHPQRSVDWKKIAKAVNSKSCSEFQRTEEQCRKKISDMRRPHNGLGKMQLLDDVALLNAGGETDEFLEEQSDDDNLESTTGDADEKNESDWKQRRKPNFAKDEVSILVDEYGKHLRRCCDSRHPQKTVNWEQIARVVSTSSASNVERSAENCNQKITDMKCRKQLVIFRNDKKPKVATEEDDNFSQTLDQDGESINESGFTLDEVDLEVNGGSSAPKRMRMPNFMVDEVAILVAEYRVQLILTSDPSNPQKKIDWNKIAEAVSTRSASKFQRTADQCQSKITDMKRRTCTGLDEVIDDEKILKGAASEAAYEVTVPNGTFVLKRFVVDLVRCDRQTVPVQENMKRKMMRRRIKLIQIWSQRKRPEKEGKFKCSSCPMKFPSRLLLFRHQTKAHPMSGTPLTYLCSFDGCDVRFPSTVKLERHLINTHASELAYFCDLDDCASGFCTTIGLEDHKRRRHDPSFKKFRCDVCPRGFMTAKGRDDHKRTHKEGKRFLCETCSAGFRSQYTLESHRGKEHGETFPCPDCPQVCASRVALKNHCMVNHLEGGRTKFLRYVCSTPDCSRRFRTPSSLRYHTQRFHSGEEKNFQCDKCPSAFTCERNLVRHTVHTHGDTKKKKCPYCSQVMAHDVALRNHIKVIHEKRTDIKCDICGEGFPLRKYYMRHRDRCHPTNVQSSTEN